ncbi:MAG: hypothetical protein AB2745_19140 [Candidatus Thiodiazotropha endolucinida]
MNPNDLLLWMAAKKSGTWSRYRAAIDELQISEELNSDDEDLEEDVPDDTSLPLHHRLKLNLERLGHAEFFRKDFESGWRVVPPILACGSRGMGVSGILCGARTDDILDKVSEISSSPISVTEQTECPDRIEIVAEELSYLEQLAISSGLYFQPDAVDMLLASIPPIDNWQYLAQAELPFGEDWEAHRFSTESLGWLSVTVSEVRATSLGLYRFRIGHRLEYYAGLRGKTYKIPVQVGKYLLLRRRRKHVVAYNSDTQVFSVPVTCRPPLLVDRALTLCSGLVPCIEGGRLIYTNVSRSAAMTAKNLLRQ